MSRPLTSGDFRVFAYNDRRDVIVATVVAGDDPLAQEQAVLTFLNGDMMRHWAEQVLGR